MDQALKRHLRAYLEEQRQALLSKVDGLNEHELRMPRTPTGTNLIGIVKHCLNVEYAYFGPVFGRALEPTSGIVDPAAYDDDPQADWYASADETTAGLIQCYRRVQAFADETIESLPLDAAGNVTWWRNPKVTLGQILIHVSMDLARHAGHADILREGVDGSVGAREPGDNMPDIDFPAYVARLAELADRFSVRSPEAPDPE
jgi:uncharacterized damage-inducible protein DinB